MDATTYQNLFVSKIPDGMTDADLLAIFAPYGAEQAFIKGRQEEESTRDGQVTSVNIRGWGRGRPGPPRKSRFGFVVFGSEAQGMQAVAALGQPSAQPNGSASNNHPNGPAPVRAIPMDLFPSRRTWKPAPLSASSTTSLQADVNNSGSIRARRRCDVVAIRGDVETESVSPPSQPVPIDHHVGFDNDVGGPPFPEASAVSTSLAEVPSYYSPRAHNDPYRSETSNHHHHMHRHHMHRHHQHTAPTPVPAALATVVVGPRDGNERTRPFHQNVQRVFGGHGADGGRGGTSCDAICRHAVGDLPAVNAVHQTYACPPGVSFPSPTYTSPSSCTTEAMTVMNAERSNCAPVMVDPHTCSSSFSRSTPLPPQPPPPPASRVMISLRGMIDHRHRTAQTPSKGRSSFFSATAPSTHPSPKTSPQDNPPQQQHQQQNALSSTSVGNHEITTMSLSNSSLQQSRHSISPTTGTGGAFAANNYNNSISVTSPNNANLSASTPVAAHGNASNLQRRDRSTDNNHAPVVQQPTTFTSHPPQDSDNLQRWRVSRPYASASATFDYI